MQCGQTACVFFIREFAYRTSAAFKDHYDQGRQFRQTWSDPLTEYASLGSGLVLARGRLRVEIDASDYDTQSCSACI